MWRQTLGLTDAVVQALRADMVVAAVGPICSAALIEAGVRPQVVPDNPKMGPLVAALARIFLEPSLRAPPNPEPEP